MKREPFPLQWPEGATRTRPDRRRRSKFGAAGQVSLVVARNQLLHELELLGAANVVITSDLPVRNDGLPYASGRADDPGVAVWCLAMAGSRFEVRAFACDRWKTHAENMTALARSIEALRGLDRWGMADATARALGGFAALPPGDSPPAAETWRAVLEMEGLTLPSEDVLAVAKARHRRMMTTAHPDAGGSSAAAARLNLALEAAELEMRGTT